MAITNLHGYIFVQLNGDSGFPSNYLFNYLGGVGLLIQPDSSPNGGTPISHQDYTR